MNKKVRNFLTKSIFMKDIKCLFCDAELDKDSRYCVCDDCLKSLPFLTGKVCKKCGEPIKSKADYCLKCKNHVDRGFDKARAEFLYRGVVADAIKDFKYHNKKYLAEYLSNFLFDVFVRSEFPCDVVIPAPISEKSLKQRGFNQTELLCSSFEDAGFCVDSTCLIKRLETQNQVALNYKDRQTNLVGAFKVANKNAVKNKNVLLVDDIFTTGATVSEISNTLKNAGAKSVFAITLCHEVVENQTKTEIVGN